MHFYPCSILVCNESRLCIEELRFHQNKFKHETNRNDNHSFKEIFLLVANNYFNEINFGIDLFLQKNLFVIL